MFKSFDQIRIINLPYRSDRRIEMGRELAKVGLAGDPRVAFFEAIRPSDAGDFYSIGARGCYLSHLEILREAARTRSSVLILEDDCQFTAAASNWNSPVTSDAWDIYYGGYDAANPENPGESNIVGSHMMGFTAATVDRLCHYLDNLEYHGGHPPIDGAYVWFRRAHRDVRAVFAVPPLAGQRSSRSDIGDLKFYDRIALIRPLAQQVRRLRRIVVGDSGP